MQRSIASALAFACACHVTTTTETTRPGTAERIRHDEGAIARRPTLVLTDAGTLRFVEPLECPTEELVTTTTTIEDRTGPNLATFIVGVIATAAGGVMTIRGATSDPASNPTTYAGVTALAIGAPLAVGPWIGHTRALRPGVETPAIRRPGPTEPCGERGLSARAATLTTVDGLEIHGAIDGEGVFAVSPFQLVDAFDAQAVASWAVTGRVDATGGARTVEIVISGSELARRAPAFLASAPFVSTIEPVRLVPGVVAGTLRASLTSTPAGPALRLVLPLKNDGPGPAWAVRGHVRSTTKAVDGRVLYVGHLAKGDTTTTELLIPLTAEAASTLRGSSLEVSVELLDAHGTAPTTPVRFRGAVLGDAPR